MRAALVLLVFLAGCAAEPRVITKTETVEVPVTKIQPIDAALVQPCPIPRQLSEGATWGDLKSRELALEKSLRDCNEDKARIRQVQESGSGSQ